MSLTTDCKFLFTDIYPNKTTEELEAMLEDEKQNIDYLQARSSSFLCQCSRNKVRVFEITMTGECNSYFHTISVEDLCSACQESLKPFSENVLRAAGLSPTDHWHPELMLPVEEYMCNLFKDAILCKEMNYDELSLDEIRDLAITMGTTQQMCNALEFELKSRVLRGILDIN